MKVVLSSLLVDRLESEYEQRLIEEAGFKFVFVSNTDEEQFKKEIVDCDAIIVADKKITKDYIESMKNCKVIVRQGIGYDTIELKRSKEKGIAVCNIPDYSIEEVSDHTMALILNQLRHINDYNRHVHEGKWDINSIYNEEAYPKMRRLSTLTLGICGFGRIGKLVAYKAKNFGFDIIVNDPYIEKSVTNRLGVKLVDFDELIRQSDVVTINTLLTSKTKNLFNLDVFKNMKKDAYLINTSRGAIVNREDLYIALKEKIIAGAAIDVLDGEPINNQDKILKLNNLIITPHSAFYTEDSYKEIRLKACEEVIRVLNGNTPFNRVNF